MARLVTESTSEPVAVVLSAMGDTTDHLLKAARLAEDGHMVEASALVHKLVNAHLELVNQEPSRVAIVDLGEELGDVIHGISLLREQTPRTRALIASFGERLSVAVAGEIIRNHSRAAVAVDARTMIQTEGSYEGGRVRLDHSRSALETGLRPLLDEGIIPVITGFISSTSEGISSTLGRGGSDYTASLVGEALSAREIWIWTDVEGILTADPRLVSEARTLESVSYREAAEMSYFGAKVIHPKTMLPAMRENIPIRIRSTLNTESPGTLITRVAPRLPQGVKTVTSVSNTALITVDGRGMSGVPGIAGRIFTTAQSVGVNVMMISQASSEQTVSLVVNGEEASLLANALNEVFALEIGAGVIETVVSRPSVAVISIIGQGMSGTPGISGKLFQSLGKVGINVLAIAQGASELSISVAVEESEVVRAVRAAHTAFGLTRIVHVVLVGCGRVGTSLLGMLADTNESLGRDLDIELKLTAVATRSKLLLSQQGIDPTTVRERLSKDAEPRPGDADLVARLLEQRFSDVLLVDVTASPLVELHEAALRAGFHVITANKVPLSMDSASYQRLVAARLASGATYGYETTFGAGLPVLHTLKELIHTGDSVFSVSGCFSGTLGFLCSRLEDGASLTETVREAAELGYTEPDPREDLSGRDVARKALIIGRALGMDLEPEQVQLEPLVPGLDAGLDKALEVYEGPLNERLEVARAAGEVLRYVAEISEKVVRVSLQSVPASSPIGSLRGPDNILVFRTRRYDDYPLVVRGPGAGADVTAAGVLGDMLKAAKGGV